MQRGIGGREAGFVARPPAQQLTNIRGSESPGELQTVKTMPRVVPGAAQVSRSPVALPRNAQFINANADPAPGPGRCRNIGRVVGAIRPGDGIKIVTDGGRPGCCLHVICPMPAAAVAREGVVPVCGKAFVTACGGARLPGAFVGFPWYRGPPRRRGTDQVLEGQGARDRQVQCQ